MRVYVVYASLLLGSNVGGFSFSSQRAYTSSSPLLSKCNLSSQDTTVTSTETTTSKNLDVFTDVKDSSSDSSTWVKHGLFISSFTDGIQSSPSAQSFLKYSLALSLLQERVRNAENAVRDSVIASPCNGPDMDAFNLLESSDAQFQSTKNVQFTDEYANQLLKSLTGDVRIPLLYIPTAMYALNPNSSNTPGKQRQRARADGKKRRNQVVKHLEKLLEPHLSNCQVLTITLDLDDGSLKQPAGSEEADDFPKNGVESLTAWSPHIVYVEGGNTFWLQHCLEKGNWEKPLRKACVGPDATSLYIGKSAGAIIAGKTVETATWKGWDDPSVVPEKETYDDWKGHPGLDMANSLSFFPHMSNDWEMLVVEKKTEMEEGQAANVICLGEFDAYCVDSEAKTMVLVTGEEPQ